MCADVGSRVQSSPASHAASTHGSTHSLHQRAEYGQGRLAGECRVHAACTRAGHLRASAPRDLYLRVTLNPLHAGPTQSRAISSHQRQAVQRSRCTLRTCQQGPLRRERQQTTSRGAWTVRCAKAQQPLRMSINAYTNCTRSAVANACGYGCSLDTRMLIARCGC